MRENSLTSVATFWHVYIVQRRTPGWGLLPRNLVVAEAVAPYEPGVECAVVLADYPTYGGACGHVRRMLPGMKEKVAALCSSGNFARFATLREISCAVHRGE